MKDLGVLYGYGDFVGIHVMYFRGYGIDRNPICTEALPTTVSTRRRTMRSQSDVIAERR